MIIIKDEILLTIHQKRSLMLNHKRIINSIKRNIFIIVVLLIVNSLFALDFEEKISEKYWLCEYYNILLEKKDRNILLDYVPRFKESPFNYYEHLDQEFYWYEDPSYLQSGILEILKSNMDDDRFLDIQEYPFTIVNIKKINEDNYKIILKKTSITKKVVDSVAYYGGVLSPGLDKTVEGLFLRFDRDYLYIYLEDETTLLCTYYAYTKEEYSAIRDAIKTNIFDMSKITFPCHADGTCDFDGSKKADSEKNAKSSATNVAPNKTMTIKENLKLRSGEATSTQVLTVMSAGTKIKILELGKAETIDGISSNWVKVEVQVGAKDRDGKTIKAGTVGWCYGGYLK